MPWVGFEPTLLAFERAKTVPRFHINKKYILKCSRLSKKPFKGSNTSQVRVSHSFRTEGILSASLPMYFNLTDKVSDGPPYTRAQKRFLFGYKSQYSTAQLTCHILSSRIGCQVPLTDMLSHLLTFFCPSAKTNVLSPLGWNRFN
jgi:hypothetical protein